jgi:long-chain acyl-CoA synthetase
MSSLFDSVSENARRQPRAPALTDGRTVIAYGDLQPAVADVVTLLLAHCSRPGPVVLCVENSAAWVLLDLALLQLGRAMVPLPTFFATQQRVHAMAEVGAAYLLTDREPDTGASGAFTIAGRTIYYDACRDPGRQTGLPEGTAKVTYTSGSTGRPKGVCLSLGGLETVAHSVVERVGAEHAGVHCAILPLAVLLENVAGLYSTLIAGGRYHVPLPEDLGLDQPFRPDFYRLAHGLAECDAKSAIMVPELLRGTMAALRQTGLSLRKLGLLAVGGATVSPHLLAEAAALGLPVIQGYGLSEMGSVVTLNGPSDNMPGTVGRPLRHVRIECAQDGELVVRYPIFLGYVGSGAAPEVYPTGDLGRVDTSGRVHFLGRKSHLIVSSFGRNVSPEWVESELLSEPAVAQAFVFGEGAPALGALVVPGSATTTVIELDEAVARVNARLPDYACVRHWSIVEPFTIANGQLTGNGRPRRTAITEEHGERMARCLRHSGPYLSFHDLLVTGTASERRAFGQITQIQDALRGLVSRDSYLAYLTEAYHHVKHTVPLMKLASASLSARQQWLRGALDEYIEEETGHEEWILNDIRNSGGDPELTRTGSPHAATERMVAYAYHYIERVNAVGFFGMVYVLEGTSIQLALHAADALMKSLQLPPECFTYLLSHGGLDVSHMAFFRRLMEKITDDHDQAAIIEVAKSMFELFGDVFSSIPHTRPAAHVG